MLGTITDPATGGVLPQYPVEANADHLPNYFRADLTTSKFICRQTNGNTLVLYAMCSNILNTRNVSGYASTSDYAQALPEYSQRRLLYFGVVKTWQ